MHVIKPAQKVSGTEARVSKRKNKYNTRNKASRKNIGSGSTWKQEKKQAKYT